MDYQLVLTVSCNGATPFDKVRHGPGRLAESTARDSPYPLTIAVISSRSSGVIAQSAARTLPSISDWRLVPDSATLTTGSDTPGPSTPRGPGPPGGDSQVSD